MSSKVKSFIIASLICGSAVVSCKPRAYNASETASAPDSTTAVNTVVPGVYTSGNDEKACKVSIEQTKTGNFYTISAINKIDNKFAQHQFFTVGNEGTLSDGGTCEITRDEVNLNAKCKQTSGNKSADIKMYYKNHQLKRLQLDITTAGLVSNSVTTHILCEDLTLKDGSTDVSKNFVGDNKHESIACFDKDKNYILTALNNSSMDTKENTNFANGKIKYKNLTYKMQKIDETSKTNTIRNGNSSASWPVTIIEAKQEDGDELLTIEFYGVNGGKNSMDGYVMVNGAEKLESCNNGAADY